MALDFDPIEEARRNWVDVGWDDADAMTAATAITRAHQIVLGRINDALSPLGLTFSRFEALALLHFTRSGSLPMGKIGERLQVHPASVTNTIDRLERDGLVRRRPHPDDGRTTLAGITSTGRRVVAEAASALAGVRFGLEGPDPVDFDEVDSALRPVRHNAGDFT